MTCETCRENLVAFLEGMNEQGATDVARHLASCETCAREAEQIRQVRQRLIDDAAKIESGLEDSVMQRIAEAPPLRLRQTEIWKKQLRRGIIGLAAVLLVGVGVFALIVLGGGGVTLADVRTAMQGKSWIHVITDAGQVKEQWLDLQNGRSFAKRFDGDAVFADFSANKRLCYSERTQEIREDTPAIYEDGKVRVWRPQTAWEYLVEPLEQAAKSHSGYEVERHQEQIDGKLMERFDMYGKDALDRRMLFSQLWVNPETKLPVRIKTRLQLGERDQSGKEWATANYDFPETGPQSIYDLGVPKNTPIDSANSAPTPEVKKILDGIRAAHDAFLPNYRAVVWREGEDEIDVMWRKGQQRWQARYFNMAPDGVPGHSSKYYLPLPLSAQKILDWAKDQVPVEVGLVAGDRVYRRNNRLPWGKEEPYVHVMHYDGPFDLLPKDSRPEEMAWPMWFTAGPVELLTDSPEVPAGTICLRYGGEGNRRHDYYIDPSLKYACVKEVWWEKRQGDWKKEREYWLTYHRIGHTPVPQRREYMDYGDPTRGISRSSAVEMIDVKTAKDSDYPDGIFDSKKLMDGAKVEGF